MSGFHLSNLSDFLGPPLTAAFTILAGYGCRVIAIVQSLKWLDETYNSNIRDGILSCCAHQIFFSANDNATAKYISESCGEKTVEMQSKTYRNAALFEAPSRNISSRARALITTTEARELPPNKQIILVENRKPVKATKIQYFKDKKLQGRELPPIKSGYRSCTAPSSLLPV